MDVWRPVDGETLFRSARLDCALSCFPGALICERERETLLAIPCAENKPFPLPELFCLARIAPVRGRRGVIYRLNEIITPVLWDNANYVYHPERKYAILSLTKMRKEVLHDEIPL